MGDELVESTRNNGVAFLDSWVEEINEELGRRARVAAKPARTGSYPGVDRFKALKDRVRIEDFYESSFPMILRRKGRNLWGLCPFPDHNEDTPSFKIDPERQNFYCFGCHKHGDIFHLAMYRYQVDTNYEALCALERDYGSSQPLYTFPARPGANKSVSGDSPYLIDVT